MTMRKYAIRFLFVALPLCAGASASTPISDSPLEDQTDGAKTSASVPSTWSEPTTAVVEVTIPPSAALSTPVASADHVLSANPLWAMPLKQFTVTRERPIFLPSRRQPAVAEAVTVSRVIVPPKPKEPEQPQLSLVGTISSDEDKFGIFVDQSTKAVLRLRVGEDFQGWKLQSVQGRDASLEKEQQTAVLSMPRIGLSQASVAVRNEAPAGPDSGKLLPVNVRPRER